jgi:hypothetical protein
VEIYSSDCWVFAPYPEKVIVIFIAKCLLHSTEDSAKRHIPNSELLQITLNVPINSAEKTKWSNTWVWNEGNEKGFMRLLFRGREKSLFQQVDSIVLITAPWPFIVLGWVYTQGQYFLKWFVSGYRWIGKMCTTISCYLSGLVHFVVWRHFLSVGTTGRPSAGRWATP